MLVISARCDRPDCVSARIQTMKFDVDRDSCEDVKNYLQAHGWIVEAGPGSNCTLRCPQCVSLASSAT